MTLVHASLEELISNINYPPPPWAQKLKDLFWKVGTVGSYMTITTVAVRDSQSQSQLILSKRRQRRGVFVFVPMYKHICHIITVVGAGQRKFGKRQQYAVSWKSIWSKPDTRNSWCLPQESPWVEGFLQEGNCSEFLIRLVCLTKYWTH
jgi:hypothetical protein